MKLGLLRMTGCLICAFVITGTAFANPRASVRRGPPRERLPPSREDLGTGSESAESSSESSESSEPVDSGEAGGVVARPDTPANSSKSSGADEVDEPLLASELQYPVSADDLTVAGGLTECRVNVKQEALYMRYEDIIRVYSTYLKSAKDWGIAGCRTVPYCLKEKTSAECDIPSELYDCDIPSVANPRASSSESSSKSSSPCPHGWSDGGQCCETCRGNLNLTTTTFTHAPYGTVYPVQFPSLDIYQTATVGFCGKKKCRRCEAVSGTHSFLVSPYPVPDPPTGPIDLIIHTEELPIYCRCLAH